MRCKRVGTLTVDEEVFDVLGVALHPRLHVLLGVADIPFVRLKTRCLVYHYQMAAFAFTFVCFCSCKGGSGSPLK
jgi:hypothetical protein